MAAYAEGLNILKNANIGKRQPREGRGDDAAPEPRALPVRLQPRRHHRAVAARQRRRLLAARPDRAGARRQTRARQVRRQGLRLRRRPLDGRRGQRRGRAGPRAHRRRSSSASPRAARTSSRTRCSRRCASASAATSRRSERCQGRTPRSDALVFFGATGDLAYKKIFPALQAHGAPRQARLPGHRRRPSRAGRASSSSSGRGPASPSTAASTPRPSRSSPRSSRYVDGDYNDPATFDAAARPSSSGAQRPAHYLAIPPSMFPAVVEQPGRGGLRDERARDRREAVRPRPRVGARAERDPPRGLPRGEHLPHRPLPRQGGGAEHPLLPLRQRVPRADLEPPLRRERPDHDGRELRRQGPRQVLRGDRRHPRRDPEPPAADRELPGHGGALLAPTPRPSATSRPRCCARCGR